ncbi:unnamed protein product [Effrenium voratum]|nr:unnamed protein product [Effrenium voratum]
MAMMRTRTKSRGMCLCLLGIALALLVQPSTESLVAGAQDFARGVPGLKEHAKRHPLHAGVARRAGAAQEDNSGQDRLDLEEVVAEAKRVVDNGTLKDMQVVMRKVQLTDPGKWNDLATKPELKQQLKKFVAEAALKALEEDLLLARQQQASAQRQVETAQRQVESAQRQVESAQRQVESAQEQEAMAVRRLARAATVLETAEDSGNATKVQEAKEEVKEAKEEVKEAKEEVKEAKEEVEKAERKVERAKKEVQAAKASGRTKESEAPLAIMANSEQTVEGLLRLRGDLKDKVPASIHGEPDDGEFQARPLESQEFLNRVSKMLGDRSRNGSLIKANSPLLEYATMSGAGKSRWGFEVERLLKRNQSFQPYAVSRIGLNFNGGTGGGTDGTETEYLSEQKGFSLKQIMATLLFTRGLLQCDPDYFRGGEEWLKGLTVTIVLDAVFKSFTSGSANKSILVVHVDELAFLLKRGFNDRRLKDFVNLLAEYNCGPNPLGLVVPVITHTAPVVWNPEPTVIQLEHKNLAAFSFEDSKKFFPGLNITGLQARLAISACGGHAALLVQLHCFMQRQAGGLGPLLTCDRVRQHEDALLNETVRPACFALVQAVLLQSIVPKSKFQDFFQLGLAFIERTRATVRVTVPYPFFLNLLMQLDRPERFKHLRHENPTGTDRRWSSKAFEALCAMRVAIDMDGFPYDLPCDPRAAAIEFRRDRKSRVCLAESDTERGVDSIGFDGNTMTLVQSKYPETDTTQEWKEIREFMNFANTTGVDWAKSANCTRICAIFATARASRNYESEWPMEINVQEVVITYVIYAKTQNSRRCAVRTKQIDEWIPPGLMCM